MCALKDQVSRRQRMIANLPSPRVPLQISLEVWLLLVALGTSLLGGLLGMASGIFIVPALTMFGHIDMHTAVGASLISVIACSCASASPYLRQQLTDIRLAVVLETATTGGALCGVLLSGFIPARYLYLLFALILFLSAQQMLSRRRDPAADARIVAHVKEPRYSKQRLTVGMLLMYGAGLISALLGIGSGVLKIPAMDTALRLPIKVSSATSTFMIGVTAAASAGAYFARGEIVTAIAAPVALGSVVGAILGARLLLYLSAEKLRLLFVGILLLLGVQMAFTAFGHSVLEGVG